MNGRRGAVDCSKGLGVAVREVLLSDRRELGNAAKCGTESFFWLGAADACGLGFAPNRVYQLLSLSRLRELVPGQFVAHQLQELCFPGTALGAGDIYSMG